MSQLEFWPSSYLVDVIIPSIWWNALTYSYDFVPERGARVIVPLGITNHPRIGFVVGEHRGKVDSNLVIKRIKEVIDAKNLIDDDLLKIAEWCGREALCGTGLALKSVLPYQFLHGYDIKKRFKNFYVNLKNQYERINFYHPLDYERHNFYISHLRNPQRCLVLFSRRDDAYKFFMNLPQDLQSKAVLWRGDVWEHWQNTYIGKYRIVIAPPGGVFAPFQPEKIILDNEAESSCCILPIAPQISIRDIAEQRAKILNATFITGGRVPSSKVFQEFQPQEFLKTDRDKIILADLHYSTAENIKGIESDILLSQSLIQRTQQSISAGKNVFWILNRYGLASEIFCQDCGKVLMCPNCQKPLRFENGDYNKSKSKDKKSDAKTDEKKVEELVCPHCGRREKMPERCPECECELFSGRRVGLEALLEVAERYVPNVKIYENRKLQFKKPALILGTSSILNLCASEKPSLIAWLNIDGEIKRPRYENPFNVFYDLWSSYWRAREKNSDRTILIQAYKDGVNFAHYLINGWKNFWQKDLADRSDLGYPPFEDLYEIKCDPRNREEIINKFEGENFNVMDADDGERIYIHAGHQDLERIQKILWQYFDIQNEIQDAPEIKIFKE